jgi:ketopantoate reductase
MRFILLVNRFAGDADQGRSPTKSRRHQCTACTQYLQTVWEKFLFISTVATLTSYLNKNIGQIRGAEAHIGLLERLLHELYRVTKTKGIALPENSIRQTLDKMASFPDEATSSMHSDYQKSA